MNAIALLVTLAATGNDEGLNFAGGVIMVTSIVSVIGLMVFCMVHILRDRQPTEQHHAPLDNDTHDQ